jgi:hypothetical protein
MEGANLFIRFPFVDKSLREVETSFSLGSLCLLAADYVSVVALPPYAVPAENLRHPRKFLSIAQ